jgi:hypothetical protein
VRHSNCNDPATRMATHPLTLTLSLEGRGDMTFENTFPPSEEWTHLLPLLPSPSEAGLYAHLTQGVMGRIA